MYGNSGNETAYKTEQEVENTSGSIKSFDSTGKHKSFRRLITRFAEKTSMQGVPYINNAKFWWARLIWCFMLLVAIVAMSLHLWYLINQYMDYPVQTKISLGFETLKFPEITICNANVMHKGRLDKYDRAEKLKELLENLHPENLVPDQYDPSYNPHATKSPPLENEQGGDYLGKDGPSQRGSNLPVGPQSGSDSDSQKTPFRGKRFIENYKTFNKTLFDGKERPNLRENEPKDENAFDGELDHRTEIEDLFKWLFMSINKRDRAELGHNITDMLISCTFNGRMCSSNMFTLHQTTEYGNCWSISSDKFKVKHPGPSGGLTMKFYLETEEYLKGLTTGYGARIQIHEQRTYPFPTEEGLFIPASMETDIGLRMRSISRENGLYGNCNNGLQLEKSTRYKYTRSACQYLCLTDEIIDKCGCFDEKLEEMAISRNDELRSCRSQTGKFI
ncbi:amiloride-sensitive sodium channel subunit alpha-like [Ruditapes philippinarum]|uniref:amiloride-sensitive sodium channel subunit alpha-like n=1 Tax=Ruditapes philippinarum TaxID=129788 RepID=UPI00295C22B4|nr:amiloride-sensitive sodium channel subunit alpha-like [Ruditapes philippinarum]